MPFLGDMLIPWRVAIHQLLHLWLGLWAYHEANELHVLQGVELHNDPLDRSSVSLFVQFRSVELVGETGWDFIVWGRENLTKKTMAFEDWWKLFWGFFFWKIIDTKQEYMYC